LAERAAQFRQRDILQLTDSFARDTQPPSYFLKRFPLSAFESKTLGNDLLLSSVESFQQAPDLDLEVSFRAALDSNGRQLVSPKSACQLFPTTARFARLEIDTSPEQILRIERVSNE